MAEVEGTLGLDFSQALADYEDFKAQVAEEVIATLNLDTADAESALSGLAGDTVEVAVDADTSGAQDALSGLEAAPVEVPVDANTEGVQLALSGLEATPVEVPTDADVSGALAAINNLGAGVDAIEIPVDVDTGEAAQGLDNLTGSAGDAAGGLDQVDESSKGANSGLNDISGTAAGVGGALGGVSNKAVGTGAALLGVGFGLKELFQAGITASTGLQKIRDTAGALAPQLQRIDVGTLHTSLKTLGNQFGSTGAEMDLASAKAFSFGKIAGLSGGEAVTFANSVQALSARAVALNPSLGNIADVSARLPSAFARTSTAAKQYGLSLSQAEINQRAMANTGKTVTSDLTLQEKAVAGVQVAIEKYGDTLGEKVAEGSRLAANRAKSVTASFKEIAEEVGKPLASGLLDTLNEVRPAAEATARSLGGLASITLPLLASTIGAVAGPVGGLASEFGKLPEPIQQAAAAAVVGGFALRRIGGGDISDGIEKVTGALSGLRTNAGIAATANSGLGTAVTLTGAAIGTYGVATGNAAQATLGFAAAGASLGASVAGLPGLIVGGLVGALGGYAAVSAIAGDETTRFERAQDRLGHAIKEQNIPAITAAGSELIKLTNVIQPGRSIVGSYADQFVGLSDALKGTGKSLGDFTDSNNRLTSSGAASLRHIVEEKIATDAWTSALKSGPPAMLATIGLVERLGVGTDLYSARLTASVRATQLATQANAQLAAAAQPLAVSFQDASTAVGGLTDRQFQVAGAASQALDSLSKLGPTQDKLNEAIKSGNASSIEAAANARAVAVAQDTYNQTLLTTGSATEAAKAASGSFREELGAIARDLPAGPAKDAIDGIIAKMDELTAHPATVNLKVDGQDAALQVAAVERAIDDITNPKNADKNKVKIFMDDTEAVAGLDGINQARQLVAADPTQLKVVLQDLASGNIADIDARLAALPPEKRVKAIAEAIGSADVGALQGSLNSLTGKQVQAVAQAIGAGDVGALQAAITGLTPKQVQAVAQAIGQPEVAALVGSVDSLNPRLVQAIAQAIGAGDVENLKAVIASMLPKTVDATAHVSGLGDVQGLLNAVNSLHDQHITVSAETVGLGIGVLPRTTGGVISRQHGGHLRGPSRAGRGKAGLPVRVGEVGEELFIPDAPGTVVPHGDWLSAIRALGHGDFGGIGSGLVSVAARLGEIADGLGSGGGGTPTVLVVSWADAVRQFPALRGMDPGFLAGHG